METLTHGEASRANLPSAEHSALLDEEQRAALLAAFERRNRDLDPQLVWRGKDAPDAQDAGRLVVNAPPLYIQERVHPKAVIDDLLRQTGRRRDEAAEGSQAGFADIFADFNGLPSEGAKTEFYQHDANWSNRMILGDSLQVMASLAEREGLRGQVQCIYLDPPYGIRFNSNFQWSTTSRTVTDGKAEHITREPEQVKAFRDTWRDGVHSYLSYLRDRLLIARELLTESGSIFVQIGDENVHRLRAVLDEVFGAENSIAVLRFRRAGFQTAAFLPETHDFILWYAKSKDTMKFRRLFLATERADAFPGQMLYADDAAACSRRIDRDEIDPTVPKVFRHAAMVSASGSDASRFTFRFQGREHQPPPRRGWSTSRTGLRRMSRAGRLFALGNTLERKRYYEDSPFQNISTDWGDTQTSGFGEGRIYVVQTQTIAVQRCMLLTTDPGDLVFDPTCGSGTTAYVAEQWGRRWITVDTSRVALALARARLMGARYRYYLLTDSADGQAKRAEISGGGGDRRDVRRHQAGLRLRAGAAHHAARHRQQCGDRRHLGGMRGADWAAAGASFGGAGGGCGAGGVGDSARGAGRLVGRGGGVARGVLARAAGAAGGD